MADHYDVIIIGAGAAGLMCAIEAGKRGRSVLIIEKNKKPAGKIRISGGGRCNFTNIHCTHVDFISENKHFHKSALNRYRAEDFIELVEKHNIAYHEKTLGQLFCDESAQQIIDMLLSECKENNVELITNSNVHEVRKTDNVFSIFVNDGEYSSNSLVIASGGASIPKMGATGFGYDVARQFKLKVVDPVPALVPLTFGEKYVFDFRDLSGVSQNISIKCGKTTFEEALLFTYKGLSGPAVLQISSYWRSGMEIIINLAPTTDAFEFLKTAKEKQPKQEIQTVLSYILPKRLAIYLTEQSEVQGRLADLSHKKLQKIAHMINKWRLIPNGTEGFATAEVTRGGVNTDEISSKTFECKKVTGLYFIGEVVDVTGHLGGFNFQWAWASGHAAGQFV